MAHQRNLSHIVFAFESGSQLWVQKFELPGHVPGIMVFVHDFKQHLIIFLGPAAQPFIRFSEVSKQLGLFGI